MAYIHPPIHRSMRCSFCSAKLSGRLHFLCIHMPSTGHKLLPASCSLLRFPSSLSLSLHLSLSSFSVCLSPTPLERQQTGVAGEEADGKDDRSNFWERKWKSEDVKKRMNPAQTHTHTHANTFYFYAALFFHLSASHINYNYVGAHMPTVHMPSIISLFDALALRLIGILESVTAYNIMMMEMSLSGSVLWVTCVLLARIEFQVLNRWCIYTVITPVYVQKYMLYPHTLCTSQWRQICTCNTHAYHIFMNLHLCKRYSLYTHTQCANRFVLSLVLFQSRSSATSGWAIDSCIS